MVLCALSFVIVCMNYKLCVLSIIILIIIIKFNIITIIITITLFHIMIMYRYLDYQFLLFLCLFFSY